MLRDLEDKRSWLTQRMANAYPPGSRVRRLTQSTGQQILEPIARELEDLYWWENYNLGNYLLTTSDPHQVENTYRLSLPPTFEWRERSDSDGVVYLQPTSVRGKASGVWMDLTQANDNSVEEFWYGVPDRTSVAEGPLTYTSVVPPTDVGSLSSVVPATPGIPSRLWVTLYNIGVSVKLYKGVAQRAAVEITGYDAYDNEVTERIVFPFDCTILTRTRWADITSVMTEYVDDTAYLQIEWLSIGELSPMDQTGVHIQRDGEKIRFYSLGNETFGSTLKHEVFTAVDLLTVEEGNTEKQSVYEIELLNTSGSNIFGTGMALWPKRRWVIVTDGSYLHFYLPHPRLEDRSPVIDRTSEVVLQIHTDNEFYLKGDIVSLDYNLRRPMFRVLKTRWSVLKPDGTRVGLSEAGAEIVYDSNGWVENRPGWRFMKTGLQKEPIEYTFADNGKYVFYLESLIADDISSTKRYAEQVDALVISVAYTTAVASVPLPVTVGTPDLICFDAYGRPWVMGSAGEIHRLNFHYDKYVADFQNKAIYTREPYTEIEVEA